MANDLYTVTGTPGNRATGSSAAVRAEFVALQAAFDKLSPTGTLAVGNALKPLRINAAGNAFEPDPSTYLTSTNALLKTAGSGQAMTGTIYWANTVSELLRGQSDNGFLSVYNAAGSIRTGYVQFTAGTHVDIAAENGADIRFIVGGVGRGTWDTSGNLNVSNGTVSVVNGGVSSVFNGAGLSQSLASTAGFSGVILRDQAVQRRIELLWLGSTQGGSYGQSQNNAVLNFAAGGTNFGMSFGDVLKHSFTASGATFTGTVAATTFTGALTGNASTATALATGRSINGVNFDGTGSITVPAAAGTLSGGTLAAGVTASSLASVAANCTDGTFELGWKGLPAASVTTGAFAATDRGKCVYATGAVTIPNATMAARDVVVVQNTTAGALTITCSTTNAFNTNTGADKGGGLTLSLSARGRAAIVFDSGTACYVSGNIT